MIWVLLYQWLENTLLSPRLSAKTMQLNGAVAFGATLAGGAIAGPVGAFMALPFAALMTAVIKNSGKRYAVVYQSTHGDAASRLLLTWAASGHAHGVRPAPATSPATDLDPGAGNKETEPLRAPRICAHKDRPAAVGGAEGAHLHI